MPVVPVLPPVTTGIYASSSVSALEAALSYVMNKPAAELRQTVAQSIPSATFTSLAFDTTDLDNNPSGTPGHSNSVNNSRYVAQYPGWYLCSGAYATALTAAGNRGTRWAVNGSPVSASDSWVPGTAAANNTVAARTKNIFLNIGDYVELQAYQSSGAPLNTAVTAEGASSMSVHWMRS